MQELRLASGLFRWRVRCSYVRYRGDVSEIIAINEGRWQIEECFRTMKTNFGARPVYLQREHRIKTHFLICFLALLRILEMKLDKKYTIKNIIDSLIRMDVCAFDAFGYIPVYKRMIFMYYLVSIQILRLSRKLRWEVSFISLRLQINYDIHLQNKKRKKTP